MNDLIDFPCSELWSHYYADRGLTGLRHSTDPRRPAARMSLLVYDEDYFKASPVPIITALPPLPPIVLKPQGLRFRGVKE